jgi:hypothetical protein
VGSEQRSLADETAVTRVYYADCRILFGFLFRALVVADPGETKAPVRERMSEVA